MERTKDPPCLTCIRIEKSLSPSLDNTCVALKMVENDSASAQPRFAGQGWIDPQYYDIFLSLLAFHSGLLTIFGVQITLAKSEEPGSVSYSIVERLRGSRFAVHLPVDGLPESSCWAPLAVATTCGFGMWPIKNNSKNNGCHGSRRKPTRIQGHSMEPFLPGNSLDER